MLGRESTGTEEEAAEGLLDVQTPPPPAGRQWRWRIVIASPLVFSAAVFLIASTRDPMERLGPPPALQLKASASFQVPDGGGAHRGQKLPMMGSGEEGCHADETEDCDHQNEGDMLLDPGQRAAMSGLKTRGFKIKKSQYGYTPHNGNIELWPDRVVKYKWDAGIDSEARRVIEEAMEIWRAKTCIDFEETTSSGGGVVLFRSSHTGCNAHVGYSARHPHYLNLEPAAGCCLVGVALHEMGHTIGLRHEHQRPEAEPFIGLNLNNADDWWKQWLRPRQDMGDISAGVPYDMGSIMHYGPTAGSIDHVRETIEVKKADVFGNCRLGQRDYLSEGDIVTVTRWYGCPDYFCADLNSQCQQWADAGYCTQHYVDYMEANCPHTCGKCTCEDTHKYKDDCPGWSKEGYCTRGHKGKAFPGFMKTHCRRSCGDCLMEDSSLCKDGAPWGNAGDCESYKDREHEGKTWCQIAWFAEQCPKTCDLCPHKPFCF